MTNMNVDQQSGHESDSNSGSTRRSVLLGAASWMLYSFADQQMSPAWGADSVPGSAPAGNPKFAEEATKLAIESVEKGWGGPFGAVIVKDGEIIGKGQNRVLLTGCAVYHAEVTAIIDASAHLNPKTLLGTDYYEGTILEMIPRPEGSPDPVPERAKMLKGCEIYINGAPCPMCMSAIYWARIDRVYFGCSLKDTSSIGFDDEFQYDDFKLPWEQRKNISVVPNFERDTCLKAYKAWMDRPDRHPY